jgi:hypothetical protein
MNVGTWEALRAGMSAGTLVPYLGPGVLELCPERTVPTSPEALAEYLTARVTVPHKIRGNLTAAAQFIENFKHRKTLVTHLQTAFAQAPATSLLHDLLAEQPSLPLVVNAWYDTVMAQALAKVGRVWGQVQGVSQAEHGGQWVHYFAAGGERVDEEAALAWPTLLYQPLGASSPASNFLVSDSDYVEVLTEIDIQTPIPPLVRELRAERNFLFLGCRFRTQLERSFARQIMKRSSDWHCAVFAGDPTRNELRFFEEQRIEVINMDLHDFAVQFQDLLLPKAQDAVA